MRNRYSHGTLVPALFAKPKSWSLLIAFLLTGFLPLALTAQTTYDFTSGATILKENPTDFYFMKAEFTSGGVVYVVSGGINGSYSNSSNNGYNNSASLKKESASQATVSIKRKDGKAFLFYGLWVKYTNGTYGSGPGFKMDYKFGCTTVKTFTNSTLNATSTPYDASGVTVTELSLSFSYLINFYLDNFMTGTVGNLPPVITLANCNDQVTSIVIPSNTKEVTTVEASDDNNDPLTYSLSGADASLLAIDATGKLSFKAVPAVSPPGDANGDGTYTVIVTVSDGKGGTDSQTINITIQHADIVFAGCDAFTYGTKAFLKRTASLDVTQGGVTRYGYSTPQSYYDANWFHINIRWDAASAKWLITTVDDYYGTTIMYSSTKNSAPYPPDLANGNWVGNNNLPDGYGACGTMSTFTGQVCGKPVAATASVTAQDVSGNGAKLGGVISDAWANTTVSFDYGTSSTLATFQTIAATPNVITAGSGETNVLANITGLQGNTTYYFRVKGINSLGTTMGAIRSFTTASTLPVTLLQLDVRKENNGTIAVTWTTTSEKNNSYFLVERSTNGFLFEVIGQVAGKPNMNGASAYRFADQAPLAGANYYRVSQADLDGDVKVLGIRKVDVQKEASVRVYPNPAQHNQLWIYSQATASERLSFSLVELSGREVLQGRLIHSATAVNTTGLAKGIYLLRLSNGQRIKVDIR